LIVAYKSGNEREVIVRTSEWDSTYQMFMDRLHSVNVKNLRRVRRLGPAKQDGEVKATAQQQTETNKAQQPDPGYEEVSADIGPFDVPICVDRTFGQTSNPVECSLECPIWMNRKREILNTSFTRTEMDEVSGCRVACRPGRLACSVHGTVPGGQVRSLSSGTHQGSP